MGVRLASINALVIAIAVCAYAEAENSLVSFDEVVDEFYNSEKPKNFEFFREFWFRDFHQVSSSRSLNIAFRSSALRTLDQYEIAFVEFRVPPELDKGVGFAYMELAPGRCYEVSKIKKKFALTPYILPPNPHEPIANISKDIFYKTNLGETSVYLKASSKGKCLLGLTRSRN